MDGVRFLNGFTAVLTPVDFVGICRTFCGGGDGGLLDLGRTCERCLGTPTGGGGERLLFCDGGVRRLISTGERGDLGDFRRITGSMGDFGRRLGSGGERLLIFRGGDRGRRTSGDFGDRRLISGDLGETRLIGELGGDRLERV